MKKYILTIVLALLYCSENATEPVININKFYNTPGNQWIYAYYDSLSLTADTVTVTVLGSLKNSDTTLWQYIFKTQTDTQYVWANNDTVTFSSLNSHHMREMILVFPLKVGYGWMGHYVTDSFTVVAQGSIIVPAGEFENVWLIEENWGALNDYGKIKSWVDPDMGMIYRYHLGWSFGMANNSWKLLSHTIKK